MDKVDKHRVAYLEAAVKEMYLHRGSDVYPQVNNIHVRIIHVLMWDEKEGRRKQARSNKQQGKATQAHQHVHVHVSR